jgi:hypothetical protein
MLKDYLEASKRNM